MLSPRALLLLLLAASAALLLLLRGGGGGEAAPAPVGRVDADSSYAQVRYRVRGPEGRLQYEIRAAELDQYLGSRRVQLTRPRLRWLRPGFRDSRATARRGELREPEIRLQEAVEILLVAPARAPALIRSPDLTLDMRAERLRTARPVALGDAGAVLRGTGLDYDLAAGTGRLESAVRSRRYPRRGGSDYRALLARILSFPLTAARAADAAPAASAAADAEAPLDLSADRVEWDRARRVAVYRGRVRAAQGSLRLRADRLTVRLDEADAVRELHAEGRSRWEQTLASGRALRAAADSIRYLPQERRAVLERQVRLDSGGHEFRGARLVYLLDEERVETAPAADGDGRVRLRLRPRGDGGD